MTTVKRRMAGFRLAAALGLILAGMAVIVGVGAVAGTASAAVAPGHTIATANALGTSDSAAGGAGAIDFWTVKLNGGDRLQLAVDTSVASYYEFQLFAPGTSDASFPAAAAFAGGDTNDSQKAVIDLQAPYNGTFVLAVCEHVNTNNCTAVDSGSGVNPMDAYTFTSSLATSVSAAVASKETRASPTIAAAPKLGLGNFEAGGGNGIDFWRVSLSGGERLQLVINTSVAWYFEFQLFAPGTSDASFPGAAAFAGGDTNDSSKAVVDLQAPYNGTFVLAVCEYVVNDNCTAVDSGSGDNPMDPYTFTPTLAVSVSAAVAAKESKAGATIAAAPKLGLGHFEAGGGNGIDFWRVSLSRGDRMQLAISTSKSSYFEFQLFPPGTNDANFPSAAAVAGGDTNGGNKAVVNMRSPRGGTYLLAVCEYVNNDNCTAVDSGSGDNPMDPYTFTTRQNGGLETRTAVKLAAGSVKYGHEKGFRFTVAVSAVYGGHPGGRVVISDGKKALCTAKVVNGKGSCALSSNTQIRAGQYAITGTYTGSLFGSRSAAVTLKVTG